MLLPSIFQTNDLDTNVIIIAPEKANDDKYFAKLLPIYFYHWIWYKLKHIAATTDKVEYILPYQ